MGEKIDVLTALKNTTVKIREWTDEKLENKVNKDGNKKLTDENYTSAEKTRVSEMVTGLTLLENKLYLKNDSGIIESTATALPSGSGGGGSSATITLKNLLDSNILTVAVGQKVNLEFSFASSETEDNGTAYIYVNSVLKGTSAIVSGENSIDISSYINEGTNEVKITCMDIYSNSKSLSYTVNAITLKITSTFDSSQVYSGDINVRYVPYGAVEKKIYFILDDEEHIAITSETGKQQTYIIPAMSHGVHTLKIYMTAIINGLEVKSNELNYDVMCITEGTTTPLVASSYNVTSVTQGELINIPFSVYDPLIMEAEVILTIKQGEEVYFSSSRTVDRTLQYWTTRDYPVGDTITFTIAYGSISKSHVIAVKENSIDVAVKTTNLEFQLKAAGKSNEDNDRDVWISGDVTTVFENINYDSTGWINDDLGDTALRLSGTSKATIQFQPFLRDARSTGRTLEICFAIRDVNNRNAVAISCLSGGIGFTVTSDTTQLSSEQSKISCNYSDEEKIYVSFVIEPKSENRLMYVYLNGILSGATQYPENDNLQQQTPLYITVGSEYCCVDLYMIRSYNVALTMDEVKNNYIADITDIGEKLLVYDDNDIYDAFGKLSYSELKDKIPILIVTGDLPTYKGDKKKVSVSYADPFNPSLDFEDTATIDVQGTSSQYYNRKNWKIKTSNPHALDLNQIETKVLCFKTDYAEASGRNNTGSANYVHTLYGDIKTPPQEEDDRVRTTIYGRPCVMFSRETPTSDLVFYGKFNGNIDKGALENFGFTDSYPLAQCVEFCNNVSDACLFHGPIPDDWSDDFEFRQPDGYENIDAFKIMHNWVVSTYQDAATGDALDSTYIGVDGTQYTNDTAEYRLAKFKKEFTDYFNFDFCLVYYLYTFIMLMVDQRAKNMFLTTWDQVHWEPWFYDNDTSFGINNEGQLVFKYYHEDTDQLDGANIYNGATSTIWRNFREAFPDEIDELYTKWRNDKLLTYEKIVEYFITKQTDKWSISIYNEDSNFKYVDELRNNNDSTYLYQIRGSAEEYFRSFIKSRLKYLDAKWNCGSYPSDYISLRIYTPMDENGNPISGLPVEANSDVTVTPYSNTYVGIQYGAGSVVRQYRAETNIPITMSSMTGANLNDLETAVFPASEISSLGDLAPLYCGTVNLSKASKLTEIKIGSGISGYQNTNLTDLSIGTNKLLKKIDIQNCPNLVDSLKLSNCPNIQEIYAVGSGITGLELPSSGYLRIVHLPGTLTNLTVTNQQYIEEFSLEGYDNLTTLRIEKSTNIPVEDIMLNAPNLNRIRLLDVSWEAESEEALATTIAKFKSCLGLDASGNNIDKSVVTGRVSVPSISDELYNDIYENFPDLVVDDGSGKPYIVNFLDRDGNSLYLIRLAEGEDAFDPIETGKIERPANIETEDAKYIFAGWSTIPTNVHSHYRVTPVYITQYAVKYYNDTTLLHIEYVETGTAAPDPVANGIISVPTKTGTNDLHYSFSGWDNLPASVQKTTKVYAQYNNVYPVRYYNEDVLYYTQWIVEGNNVFDPVASGDIAAPTKSSDVTDMFYIFSAWDNIPTNITAITEVYATYDIYWAVRFYNESVEVDMQKIKEGSSAVNPITRSENPIETPTKESTAQYDYTFSKWDGDYSNITEPTKIYAIYNSTIRKYTVYFYNLNTLLWQQDNVPYGSDATEPVAAGTISTPTKLDVSEEDVSKYDFTGWGPSYKNIQGETKCYAIFRYNAYLEDDWATIAANVENGTAVDLYPIGARKEMTVTLSDEVDYTIDVEIIAHNHDNLADGSGKATLTFFCKNLPYILYQMCETNTSGWQNTDMRTFVNGELFNALPTELRSAIKTVSKISDGGANSKTLVTTEDKCWLASYNEVGLVDGTMNLTGQGELYKDTFTYGSDGASSRIKYLPDGYTPYGWWLRTSCYSTPDSTLFYRVTNSGGTYGDRPSGRYYVAFGFCI